MLMLPPLAQQQQQQQHPKATYLCRMMSTDEVK
jgi:hypothetical protein